MKNNGLIPAPSLASGDRVRLAFVPSAVTNVELGAMGIIASAPTTISGTTQVKVKLDDGRSITWNADELERICPRFDRDRFAAEVRQGTRRSAVLFSCGVNAQHGLRRSNADKRRAVLTLLQDQEWSQWSNVAIAKACGVTESFVRKLKKESQ